MISTSRRTFGEFLPFEDGAFQTVVSGTSLDHALLLDRTFAEIARVMRPSGRFVVWIGTSPDAAPYDPYAANVPRIDDFHLFHFSVETFERAVRPFFAIAEKMSVEANHWFYALRKI